MKVTKLNVAVKSTLSDVAENIRSRVSVMNDGADELKVQIKGLADVVKGWDSFVTEQFILGLSQGMKGLEIGKLFLVYEKDMIKHFEGTPRAGTIKQSFSNIRRVAPSLDKVIGKDEKGVAIKGSDKLRNAKGLPVPLQTVARAMPTRKAGVVAKVEVAITQEMKDYASELAGECDWNRALATKVLALVFAEATKKAA